MKEMSKMKEIRGKENQKFPEMLDHDDKDDREFKKADIILKINIIGFIILVIMTFAFVWWNLFGDNVANLLGDLFGDKVTLKIQNDDAFDSLKIQNNNAFDSKLFFIFFTVSSFMLFVIIITDFYYFWKYWRHFWVKYSKPQTLEVIKDILKELKKDNLI